MGLALTSIRRFSGKIAILFAAAFALICISTPAKGEMKILEDQSLSEITASGYSQFTLTQGVVDIARVDLNLQAATYTQIEAMKIGYHDRGVGTGWDQNWNGTSLGTPADDLVLKEFVFQAEFTDIDNPTARNLREITIGFNDVTGTMTADLSSFTGRLNGTDYDRANLGDTTITLTNEPVLLKLSMDDGIAINIGF